MGVVRDELMSVSWDADGRTWAVAARASANSGWANWEGTEDELDELLALARDVMTGG
jgi:hypothetical protein